MLNKNENFKYKKNIKKIYYINNEGNIFGNKKNINNDNKSKNIKRTKKRKNIFNDNKIFLFNENNIFNNLSLINEICKENYIEFEIIFRAKGVKKIKKLKLLYFPNFAKNLFYKFEKISSIIFLTKYTN